MLLYRISFVLACLFFVEKATAASDDMGKVYTDWIKKHMQGSEALSETLGKLTDKMSGHIESSRGKISEAISQLQEVLKSYEYSKCSKNILVFIKSLDGHDFQPCYNKEVYNKTMNRFEKLKEIRNEIPDQCKSSAAMADSQVMNNCVNQTGQIVMKHIQDFEGSLKDYTDALKQTSNTCVAAIKKKFDTFLEYVNAGCPDGVADTKRRRK